MAVASTLGRNNAQGAIEVYRRGLLAGTWTPDDSRRILAMQDDPTELLGLMKLAAGESGVADALRKIAALEDAKFPPPRPRPWERGPAPDARTDVRQALGNAAHAMSDQEIDAVIAAAQGGVRTDATTASNEDIEPTEAISDVDLAPLADLDAPMYWHLENESDGDANDDLTPDERAEAASLVEEFGTLDDDETRTGADLAQRMDAAGYNPNRHPDGKFAPGPHAKQTGAPAVSRAAARAARAGELRDVHAGRLAEAKIAKREAVAEARGMLKEARAAAVAARKSPTATNKRAAQVAANKAARATKRVDKHTEIVARHTVAHSKAKDAHLDAKMALREAKSPAKKPTETPGAGLEGEIVKTKPIGKAASGINQSFVVTYKDGGKAVWKPTTGEQDVPPWIPSGTMAKREAATYSLAKHIGVETVPETAMRRHDGHDGSVQRWRDGVPSFKHDGPVDRATFEQTRLLDFVTGNSDRHDGNMLIGEHGKAIAIDNGQAFGVRQTAVLMPTIGMSQFAGAGLMHETHQMISRIDQQEISILLHKSGIEKEAIKHVAYRVAYLKNNPNMLAIHEKYVPSRTFPGTNVLLSKEEFIDSVHSSEFAASQSMHSITLNAADRINPGERHRLDAMVDAL